MATGRRVEEEGEPREQECIAQELELRSREPKSSRERRGSTEERGTHRPNEKGYA